MACSRTPSSGLIDTPTVSHLATEPDELRQPRHRRSPTGWMGSRRDVANAAVFLASPRARFIGGVCLPVDGAMAAVRPSRAPAG